MREMRIWMLIILVTGCDPAAIFEDKSHEPERGERRERGSERDREPPPPRERKPLQIEWTKDTIGNSKGMIQGGGEVDVSGYKGKYHLTMRNLPKWSKWKTRPPNSHYFWCNSKVPGIRFRSPNTGAERGNIWRVNAGL